MAEYGLVIFSCRKHLLNMLQIERKSQVLSFLLSDYKKPYYIDFD